MKKGGLLTQKIAFKGNYFGIYCEKMQGIRQMVLKNEAMCVIITNE